jgi:BirA family transcriptional regulator, biotin operon repressor / biotin---[acetyl-CoA-carboxylase] ligase
LYKIPANTLFMGKNLVFVPDCPSTNTLALQISQQSPVNEGTLVITDHQTAGKGQRGNVWEAEPHQNLTFSLILKPGFLAINKQFFLNIVVSLALRDYLKEKTPDNVYIKWPNDILVHEKKISGILIENQLQGSAITNTIAGIGFNVNQRQFSSPYATSLSAISGRTFDLDAELSLILGYIESRYLQLRVGQYELLMNAYLAPLFRRHQKHKFSSHGHLFEGVVEDVDESGRLRVRTDEGMRSFGVKEIQYL